MMRLNNKASMQLSINAIVILVMAMAVLGIGLGLIRGVLAPAQTNLEEALGKVDLNDVATSSVPISNIPKTVPMKVGKANDLFVSFYNADESDCTTGAELNIVCGSASAPVDRTQSLPIDVPVGTAQTLIATFTPVNVNLEGTPATFSGTMPCKVRVECGTGDDAVKESKSVFIDFNT